MNGHAIAGGCVLACAADIARELGDLPIGAFALTKRQLRGPALSRIRAAGPQIDPAVQEIWESPATLTGIRDYVGRRFGRP